MTHDRPTLSIGLVACALLHACAGQQFTPQQEWVYTKFPECQTRTNAFNVKLDRVEPDGRWHVTVQQTQTDYNLLAECMKAEWAAQLARLQKDDAEAMRWYRAGAEAGNTPSMAVLGHMYAAGKGVPKNEAEAVPGTARRRTPASATRCSCWVRCTRPGRVGSRAIERRRCAGIASPHRPAMSLLLPAFGRSASNDGV